MGKKVKPLQVSVEVPDEKHMKHIADAYGLVCQYRAFQKVPVEKLELWLLRLVVEGCNAIFNYHNAQVKAINDKKKQAEGTGDDVSQVKLESEQPADGPDKSADATLPG